MATIFKKAKLIYNNTLILKKDTGIKGEYYEAQDLISQKWHSITIKTDLYGTTFSCDCTDQSLPHATNLKNGKQALCSHIISVIYKKYFETKIR